ncbi:MAG: hypothetical protein KBT84_11990, partial [Pseudomonas sp.]|nr:hypothetical protein [Pseudomonas sp.]
LALPLLPVIQAAYGHTLITNQQGDLCIAGHCLIKIGTLIWLFCLLGNGIQVKSGFATAQYHPKADKGDRREKTY